MALTERRGTLFIETLVPFYQEDKFPIVYSNDVKGGIHGITSSARETPGEGFSLILPDRRQWGMLAYVYNDNATYQLRPIASGTISNDDNWVVFSSGGGSSEWVDSVKDIVDNAISIDQKNTGDRYLISSNPAGPDFGTQKNKIAVWNAVKNDGNGGWDLETPTQGYSLRVDSLPGTILTFNGTSSTSGFWFKEYQNQIRYIEPTSVNGRTFSFTTTNGQPTLIGYTHAIYFAMFGTANSGTASLSIDGNVYLPILKPTTTGLSELTSGDFNSGVRYQLTYESNSFQINLPSAGSGVIGPAEDPSGYTDGLFTDFTTSTPVGTAVDRFNEILKFLVPPPAPDLSSYNVTSPTFVPGKLSYNYTAQQGLGINSTTFSDIGDVTLNELYSSVTSTRRLGIKAYGSGDITGRLNPQVAVHPGRPTPSYATFSFGNGITGSVALYINDVEVNKVELMNTNYAAIDTTNTNSQSGFILSAATASKFSTGEPFDNFWYRTGTYLVKFNDANVKVGFNSIQVKHLLPASTLTLSKLEFLTDSNTTNTTFNSAFPTSYVKTFTKSLSGVKYYTSGTQFQHNQEALNIYANTYYPDADAGVFTDVSPAIKSNIFKNSTSYDTNTPTNGSLQVAFTPDVSPNQALPNAASVASTFTFNKKFNVLPGVRKINGTTNTRVTAKRTVQVTVASAVLDLTGWFIDTFDPTSTDTFEGFDDENRRISVADYNTVASVTGAASWDSTSNIRATNALQVGDSRLFYPAFAFNTAGSSDTNPNNPSGVDYSSAAAATTGSLKGPQSRTYIRAFRVGNTPPRANLNVVINYRSTTFVSAGTSLVGSPNNTRCILEFKLPWNGTVTFQGDTIGPVGGAATGWLDATKPSLPNRIADGDGCLVGNVPPSNGTWQIGFGTRNTAHSTGWVLLRFTAGSEWTGVIESISVEGA